jgi:hypothetical protein
MRYLPVCAAVLAVVSAAPAVEEVVLEADADSYVKSVEDYDAHQWYGDDNYGGEDRLEVLSFLDPWYVTVEYAYVHFDFSGLDEYDAADLVTARLVFFCEDPAQGVQQVYLAAGHWGEMSITYNNQPPSGDRAASYMMQAGYNSVYLNVGLIAPWVDAPQTAYGLRMEDAEQLTEDDDHTGIISSREAGAPAELRLTFSKPAVEGASWGQIKARF